jgi:alcohol dehydrogenase class IV
LRDVGIGAADLPRLTADAMNQTRLLVNNPRPVCYADALAIYEAAL